MARVEAFGEPAVDGGAEVVTTFVTVAGAQVEFHRVAAAGVGDHPAVPEGPQAARHSAFSPVAAVDHLVA